MTGLLSRLARRFRYEERLSLRSRRVSRGYRIIEAVGDETIASPDRADVTVDGGHGLVLAGVGDALTSSQRRILTVHAAQAASLLERDRLITRAADATRLREVENARRILLATVSHDLRTPSPGSKRRSRRLLMNSCAPDRRGPADLAGGG